MEVKERHTFKIERKCHSVIRRPQINFVFPFHSSFLVWQQLYITVVSLTLIVWFQIMAPLQSCTGPFDYWFKEMLECLNGANHCVEGGEQRSGLQLLAVLSNERALNKSEWPHRLRSWRPQLPCFSRSILML